MVGYPHNLIDSIYLILSDRWRSVSHRLTLSFIEKNNNYIDVYVFGERIRALCIQADVYYSTNSQVISGPMMRLAIEFMFVLEIPVWISFSLSISFITFSLAIIDRTFSEYF
jgi:hypothetical protein